MRSIFCSLLILAGPIGEAQNNLNIVPVPAEVKMAKGYCILKEPVGFLLINNSEGDETGNHGEKFFQDYLTKNFGLKKFVDGDTHSYGLPTEIFYVGEEAKKPKGYYELNVTSNKIYIKGTALGKFYAFETLTQIITRNAKNQLVIPNCTIKDFPRFTYRGMHFDVCRHFFPVSFIKKYIDYLAAYKFNTFHWHLTDDQGWRIEIKKYPELTTIGAQRNGTLIGRYPGKGNDNKPYGGFYTQQEIKEVVQYAKSRYIDVIPEIEMPGHSSAAIAACPWLSCFPGKATEIPANMISQKSMDEQKAGRIKLVQETWGVFDDVFCAGKDSTFKFLENVLDEVSALFPSKYIHIGGDESPKTHWKICPACQQRMKDNNLKDEHELQSWFVQRIEKYLNRKGKTIIGWDEILEGGLAPNAVVMSWRGEKGGIEAAKQKHHVIMTPGNPLYFDHTQSKNEDSVTFGGYNPIENVYAYEPVSMELNAGEGKYILGAQANMWTEYMEYPNKVEYQLFPRITALSEVLWSPKEKRDWKDFERRLPIIFERSDRQKINYSKAYYDLKATVLPTENYDGVSLNLETKGKEFVIKYINDEILLNTPVADTFPKGYGIFAGIDWTYAQTYTIPILVRSNNKVIAGSYYGKEHTSNPVIQAFYFNKATGKKITLTTEPDKKYPGDGAFTLVNGVQNEKGMAKSSEFLGFNGTDMEAIIDLGKETEFKAVIVNTLTLTGSWIYPPKSCNFFISNDGISFTQAELLFSDIEPYRNRKTRIRHLHDETYKARYIKVIAKNWGIIPAGNAGAGNPAWLFADEIEVQ